MFVITADQRASRTHETCAGRARRSSSDCVGDRLAAPAERTVGDEMQLATAIRWPPSTSRCISCAKGAGASASGSAPIESHSPGRCEKARGQAFLHARDAVERAKTSPRAVAVRAPTRGRPTTAEASSGCSSRLRDRRAPQGWEVADLLGEGMTQKRAAGQLGITPTAVSLRAKAACLRTEEAAIPRSAAGARPTRRGRVTDWPDAGGVPRGDHRRHPVDLPVPRAVRGSGAHRREHAQRPRRCP